jgi:hypothetical protein
MLNRQTKIIFGVGLINFDKFEKKFGIVIFNDRTKIK